MVRGTPRDGRKSPNGEKDLLGSLSQWVRSPGWECELGQRPGEIVAAGSLAEMVARRGDVMQVRRYTFKLYPNKAQIARFERNLDLHRTLYNAALEERIEAYRKAGKTITRFDQSKSVPEIRKVYPEIGELQANAIIETLVRLDNAYQAFFRRAKAGAGASSGFPRFKGKHFFDSWTYPADYAFGFEQTGPSKFRLRGGGPKKDDTLGWVKARGALPVEVWRARTATVMRRDGSWWLSLAVQIPERRAVGDLDATVRFDLIDRFAHVEFGPMHSPLDGFSEAGEQIIATDHPLDAEAAAAGLETGGECRDMLEKGHDPAAAAGLETGGECRNGDGFRAVRPAAAGLETGPDLSRAIEAEHRLDELKSERDRRFKRGSWRWRERRARIARASAKAARARKDALHVWTTKLTAACRELTVIAPPVREHTRSAKGNEKFHGAAVETNALLNRSTLSQAPAAAVQMLAYKAAEAGVTFRENADPSPAIVIGREISIVKKTERKVRRKLKERTT